MKRTRKYFPIYIELRYIFDINNIKMAHFALVQLLVVYGLCGYAYRNALESLNIVLVEY